MQARFRLRHADGAGKGLQRDLAVLAPQCGGQGACVVFPDRQGGVGELVCQQAETRNVRRPPPSRSVLHAGGEILQRHLQRVTRFGPLDIDRARDRVDLAEIQRGDIGHGARRAKLARRRIHAVEKDR